jgi:hypothetical protein
MMNNPTTHVFGNTKILLEFDPNDRTPCVDSLTIKVNGTLVPITAKYWCELVTPAGTLEIPSCVAGSPQQPTWKPAG